MHLYRVAAWLLFRQVCDSTHHRQEGRAELYHRQTIRSLLYRYLLGAYARDGLSLHQKVLLRRFVSR